MALTLDGDEIEYDSKSIKMIVELYNSDIKRLIKAGKDLSERLEMIHDKLFYLDTNIELKQLEDYSERKKFVDNLYAGKESQNKVKQSYMANYDIEDKDFHWNVAFLDGKQYAGQVDLFVGGSPCQSFSLVGKQRGLEDTRGTLFYEYARLVNEIQDGILPILELMIMTRNSKASLLLSVLRKSRELNGMNLEKPSMNFLLKQRLTKISS